MKQPSAQIPGSPLQQSALMALREAVEDVIREHAQKGLPIHIWRDGKIVELSAEELRNSSTESEK